MSEVLRRQAATNGIILRNDGIAPVDAVVAALRWDHNLEEVIKVIDWSHHSNSARRFEMGLHADGHIDGRVWIRAKHHHTIPHVDRLPDKLAP